jgi:hypothetical protein
MHQPGKAFRRFGNMAGNMISLGHFDATNELAVHNERKARNELNNKIILASYDNSDHRDSWIFPFRSACGSSTFSNMSEVPLSAEKRTFS